MPRSSVRLCVCSGQASRAPKTSWRLRERAARTAAPSSQICGRRWQPRQNGRPALPRQSPKRRMRRAWANGKGLVESTFGRLAGELVAGGGEQSCLELLARAAAAASPRRRRQTTAPSGRRAASRPELQHAKAIGSDHRAPMPPPVSASGLVAPPGGCGAAAGGRYSAGDGVWAGGASVAAYCRPCCGNGGSTPSRLGRPCRVRRRALSRIAAALQRRPRTALPCCGARLRCGAGLGAGMGPKLSGGRRATCRMALIVRVFCPALGRGPALMPCSGEGQNPCSCPRQHRRRGMKPRVSMSKRSSTCRVVLMHVVCLWCHGLCVLRVTCLCPGVVTATCAVQRGRRRGVGGGRVGQAVKTNGGHMLIRILVRSGLRCF